ncbi:MAG: hypothetical protein IJ608_04045 [Lachnospiraceae bacterium]|nr:hypothetical protein [Lachnospiraceae bacterium]
MTPIEMDELENVTGGANIKVTSNTPDPAEMYIALESEWRKQGFPENGATRHQLDSLCDKWEAAGFKPDARTFLEGEKWW